MLGAVLARLASAWLAAETLDLVDLGLAAALALLLTAVYRRWLLRQVEARRRRRLLEGRPPPEA
ncbi:MAG TPA: hypothetical protein VFG79_16055 [Solirubrobacter sp.]|nr:hypothetical protein [Solirubrobacter sp.]